MRRKTSEPIRAMNMIAFVRELRTIYPTENSLMRSKNFSELADKYQINHRLTREDFKIFYTPKMDDKSQLYDNVDFLLLTAMLRGRSNRTVKTEEGKRTRTYLTLF